MKDFTPLLPFLVGWFVLSIYETTREMSTINFIFQMLVFVFAACLPAMKTGRMSYVDIAWPWGLVAIGLVSFIFGEGDAVRVGMVSLIYILMGARMGLGALKMWRQGWLKQEFPRYQYQRRRWEKVGKTNIPLVMQVEIMVQGLANASYLAMPAFVMVTNANEVISVFEVIGMILWLAAYAMESTADIQKLKFLRRMKREGLRNKVCNVGLWRYSRHPNYFAEWMVWNALVIAALPSWLALYGSAPILLWASLGLGLLFASRIMYTTLVYYTGAVPAEYYSLQKRPDYLAYQQTTNRFFPGPVKVIDP